MAGADVNIKTNVSHAAWYIRTLHTIQINQLYCIIIMVYGLYNRTTRELCIYPVGMDMMR